MSKPLIAGYALSNGKQLVSMFIPLLLPVFYTVFIHWKADGNRPLTWLPLVLFVLLVIPFYDILLRPFQFIPESDASRYYTAASNIARNKTLWGSDDLVYGSNKKVYMFQPGYRYYLAAWLATVGVTNRLFQFFNMGLYLLSLAGLLSCIKNITIDDRFRKGFLLFILLASPYVAKNILMGLSEWLVVTIFFFFAWAWFSKKVTLAFLLLALIPFMRQNLLVAAVLVFAWLFYRHRHRWVYAVSMLLLLLLPLYHNLYFAGQWKFICTYNSTEQYLVLDFDGSAVVRTIKTFFYHIVLYGGVDWLLYNDPMANVMAVLFIPLGTALYVYCIRRLKGNERRLFLLLSLAAIVPTLVFGGRSYYPRFEWVNLQFTLLLFWLIHYNRSARQLFQQAV